MQGEVRVTLITALVTVLVPSVCSIGGFLFGHDPIIATISAIIGSALIILLVLGTIVDSVKFREIPWRVAVPATAVSLGMTIAMIAARHVVVSVALGVVVSIAIVGVVRVPASADDSVSTRTPSPRMKSAS